MAIIKARLAHSQDEDRYFEFEVVNYGLPQDCIEHDDYQPDGGRYGNWYYINSQGFAQMFDPAKPNSKYPVPRLLIVVPVDLPRLTAKNANKRRSWRKSKSPTMKPPTEPTK